MAAGERYQSRSLLSTGSDVISWYVPLSPDGIDNILDIHVCRTEIARRGRSKVSAKHVPARTFTFCRELVANHWRVLSFHPNPLEGRSPECKCHRSPFVFQLLEMKNAMAMGHANGLISRSMTAAIRPSSVCHRCWYRALNVGSRRTLTSSAHYDYRTGQSQIRSSQTLLLGKSNRSNVSRTQKRSFSKGGTAPTTLEEHQKEVEKVAASVRGFYERGEKFRMFHGGTNSTRKSAVGRDPKKVVDTSRLNHVVHVDTEKRTALVEPNVPMDRLVEETLKYRLSKN